MKNPLKQILLAGAALLIGSAVLAKLPSPELSDEAKAKADQAKAKTAWGGKVAGYQLCKSQDQAAANYFKTAKASGKEARPAPAMPPCADPGPFVYPPATAAPAAVSPAPVAAVPAKKP